MRNKFLLDNGAMTRYLWTAGCFTPSTTLLSRTGGRAVAFARASTKKTTVNPMKANKFTRKPVVGIVAITACALMFPAVAGMKKKVTRPVKVNGNMVLVFTPDSPDAPFGKGDYKFMDWGQGAHVGRFSDTATGTMDLGIGVFLSGEGMIVAANGDTINWKVSENPNDGPNVVVYTDGTGRFEKVSGGFAAEVTPVGLPVFDEVKGTYTWLLTYVGRGEITY